MNILCGKNFSDSPYQIAFLPIQTGKGNFKTMTPRGNSLAHEFACGDAHLHILRGLYNTGVELDICLVPNIRGSLANMLGHKILGNSFDFVGIFKSVSRHPISNSGIVDRTSIRKEIGEAREKIHLQNKNEIHVFRHLPYSIVVLSDCLFFLLFVSFGFVVRGV